jgi:Sulfatase
MTATYTRRTILRSAASGGAALAVGASDASSAHAQQQSERPNIVFILADDMGHADISCNGRRDYTTPNIDRIAARGARFTQAYANSPVCTASRVAIITGRYQVRLAVGAGGADRAAHHKARHWPAAETPELALAFEEGWLRHDAGRQMASRQSPRLQPAEQRL